MVLGLVVPRKTANTSHGIKAFNTISTTASSSHAMDGGVELVAGHYSTYLDRTCTDPAGQAAALSRHGKQSQRHSRSYIPYIIHARQQQALPPKPSGTTAVNPTT